MVTASDAHDRKATDGPSILRWAALLAGNMALALGPWSVRLADSGPVAAGFWRLALALPVILFLAHRGGEALTGLPRRTAWMVALGGLAFGLDLASWHVGIEMTRLGNATLFGNSGSIVLLFWGFIIAWHWPTRSEGAAIALALGGAAILLARSAEISTQTLLGDLFCLAAGMFYAVYLLTLQDARQRAGSWSLLARVCLFACPVLLLIAILRGEPVWPTDWGALIVLALVSQVIGQGLLVYSLKAFPPLVIGLALLTQPAIGVIVGWFVFSEAMSPLDVLGMMMLGVALVIARSRAP